MQNRPSSQTSGAPGSQTPPPSQTSLDVQASPSSHELPTVSKAQTPEQQSPGAVLPSSQSSPVSTTLLPQVAGASDWRARSTFVRVNERPFAGLLTEGPFGFSRVLICSGGRVGSASSRSAAWAAA